MSILPDSKLREQGEYLIFPFHPNAVQPASIDVRLDSLFRRARRDNPLLILDPSLSNDDIFDPELEVPEGEAFDLEPNDFALGSTFEVVTIPVNLVARFEGKSSLGRLGLLTHVTAGFVDPGFKGHITLELKNVTNFTMRLYPGMKIGQICFEELSEPVEHPYGDPIYGSHYQGQRGPTLSRSYQSFTTTDVYSSQTS